MSDLRHDGALQSRVSVLIFIPIMDLSIVTAILITVICEIESFPDQ